MLLVLEAQHTERKQSLRRSRLLRQGVSWLALVQCLLGIACTSIAFGLFVYNNLRGGSQQLLVLSLARFTFLFLVGVLTLRAFAPHSDTPGAWPALCKAAVFAQLLWFSSELVLGSALLAFLPLVRGPHPNLVTVAQASSLTHRAALGLYAAGMTGCLCFLSHFARRRRRGAEPGSAGSLAGVPGAGCCGVGLGRGGCSPVGSESGSYSSGSSALFYPHSGAASPTGPLTSPAGGVPAAAGAVCSVVLVEHEVSGSPDGRGLFVHKALRPIRTRPSDRPYVPLLKPIISNSFSFGGDGEGAVALRAGLGVAAPPPGAAGGVQQSGGSFNFNGSLMTRIL
eukprot:scaffold12.g8163.t1